MILFAESSLLQNQTAREPRLEREGAPQAEDAEVCTQQEGPSGFRGSQHGSCVQLQQVGQHTQILVKLRGSCKVRLVICTIAVLLPDKGLERACMCKNGLQIRPAPDQILMLSMCLRNAAKRQQYRCYHSEGVCCHGHRREQHKDLTFTGEQALCRNYAENKPEQ